MPEPMPPPDDAAALGALVSEIEAEHIPDGVHDRCQSCDEDMPCCVLRLLPAALALGPCIRALEAARPAIVEHQEWCVDLWSERRALVTILEHIDAALLAARAACAGEGPNG